MTESLSETAETRVISQARLPYIEKLVALLENHLEEIDAHISSALELSLIHISEPTRPY